MKLVKKFAVIMVGLALSVVSSQAQLMLNFGNVVGSTIQFNGTNSTFQFNNANDGDQWAITSETGGSSALGLLGYFNTIPTHYGAITSIPLGGSLTYQYATVTGPLGMLTLQDGVGTNLTGTVNWEQVTTTGSAGSINGASLTVNVTGLAYSGSNPDLNTLVAEGPATLDVSFQYSIMGTLTQLTSGSGPYATSFSGSMSVVPEPATVSCLLLGLGVLATVRRFKKII